MGSLSAPCCYVIYLLNNTATTNGDYVSGLSLTVCLYFAQLYSTRDHCLLANKCRYHCCQSSATRVQKCFNSSDLYDNISDLYRISERNLQCLNLRRRRNSLSLLLEY